MLDNRTIAAISTGTGGGVGMVRISGNDAIDITKCIFKGRKNIEYMQGYTGTLGKVFDEHGELDEAVLFVYRAPNSYTGEDVCEISCHGGEFVLNKVVEAAVKNGAFLFAGVRLGESLWNLNFFLSESVTGLIIIFTGF